ncbi:surface protease GP63, partial [Trypanosoma rangeli]
MTCRLLQPTPFLPLALALLLLAMCCAAGCLAAADRRAFDEVLRRSVRPSTAVLREVPRRGQGAMQAYTVATAGDEDDGWAPIRIKVFTEDLEKESRGRKKRYCEAAGDKCTNYLGATITCSITDVLSGEKKQRYKETIIPGAVKLHAERLLV